jgi:glycosyltransferase involved in cell wall biosynthesis
MELVLIDSGLVNKAGHSYTLAKLVSQAMARRSLPHRIFALRGLDPAIAEEIGAIAHFSRSLYDSESLPWGEKARNAAARMLLRAPAIPPAPSEQRSFDILNRAYERDLRALPSDVWQPGNIVCITAISQNQLLGLVRFLISMPEAARPGVACQLMFPPRYVPWGVTAKLGREFYRRAFDMAAPLIEKSLFFTVENKAMQKAYRKGFGISTRLLPVPFGASAPSQPLEGRPRIGFFGDSKCDKGFHLLPGAIELCQRKGVDAGFLVQVQHSGWEERTVAAEHALRRLPGVEIIEGILPGDAYAAWTSRADIMLLPYDPIAFGPERGSGIFTECMAAGRPIVASEGTYAGTSVANGEAEGEVFAPYTSEALAEAIERLIPRLAACRARAAGRAQAFAESHSPDAYIDVLLSCARA